MLMIIIINSSLRAENLLEEMDSYKFRDTTPKNHLQTTGEAQETKIGFILGGGGGGGGGGYFAATHSG